MTALEDPLAVSVSDHLGPELVLLLLGHPIVLMSVVSRSALATESAQGSLIQKGILQTEVLVSKPLGFLLRRGGEVASVRVERVGVSRDLLELGPTRLVALVLGR